MFEVTLQGKKYLIEQQGNAFTINGNAVNPDLVRIDEHRLHLLINGKGYTIERQHAEGSDSRISVNKQAFESSLRTELDLMLEKMGINSGAEGKVNELKAPMPGLVLRIVAQPGDEVKKGDALLVLESMKMENVLKAPGAGVVDKVLVTTGNAVEKGQPLVLFR